MKRLLTLFALLCVILPYSAFTAPQNIIVMISDGCGFEHVRSAEYYRVGQDSTAVFQSFPVRLAACTWSLSGAPYNPDVFRHNAEAVLKRPTDSAAAATALATGRRTLNGSLGVDGNGTPCKNITERAYDLGKATGVVTTVQFIDATPAGFTIHASNRRDYTDIGREMLCDSHLRVCMGCGNPAYVAADSTAYVEKDFLYVGGRETWNRVLAREAMSDCDNDGENDAWTPVFSREAFQRLATSPAPRRLLGVPRTGKGLQQLRPGNEFAAAYAVPFTPGVPTLAELTRAALNTLDDDPDGFFLMVEGGAVDRASHENSAGRMIEEQIDFVAAVDAVVDWVEAHGGWERTLVVVTADHETGCLSGPGSACEGENVKLQPVENRGQGHMPGIMWFSGNHSNNLVPFYAKGPGAEEFAGNLAGRDPVRGDYIENISIGLTLHRLWGGQ